MTSADTFPLPFESLRKVSGGKEDLYVIGAMFTREYAQKAQRLAASCEKFGLSFVMHEVPAVHRSVNSRGTSDPSFTKANFIHYLLTEHKKPVLYVDADCEFHSEPELLVPLAKFGCDFAIYNWLADEYTDAFEPMEISVSNGQAVNNRFYIFTHRVEHFATDQLLCSGPVQFYGNSDAARALLSQWFGVIKNFPGCADDECLDFAFNNFGPLLKDLNTFWLPKAYARYSWWIYAKPVINHAESLNEKNEFVPLSDPAGRLQFYPDRTEKRDEVRLFPRGCIIDTRNRMVCRMAGNQLVVIGPTDQNFWL